MRLKQPYSLMKHALLSAYGGRWREKFLVMYASYNDDSGTAPDQLVAIAAALIIPAYRLPRLESEWNAFLLKQGIPDFHTSECVARNPKSAFAGWDDNRVRQVLARVRQIIRKYAVQAFAVSVDKATYDEVIPNHLRKAIGDSHYTLAFDGVGGFIRSWGTERDAPMEYVFDNTGKQQRKEIERVMEHGEELHPGLFQGHYSFRNRKEVPALQCADLFAWTIYQRSISYMHSKPISPFAEECWEQFSTWEKNGGEDWAGCWFARKPILEKWVRDVCADKKEMERIARLK